MSSGRASVLSGTVTRTWFTGTSTKGTHVLQLRHNTVSGYRYAIVDGREVHGSDGTTSLLSQEGDAHDIVLSVGDSTAVIRISPCGSTGFEYLCSFNGSLLTELNMMPELAVPADSFEVSVPMAETLRDEQGKSVVYYRVDSVRGDDGQEKSALHRFSEFDEFNSDIRGGFEGSHTFSMLPILPPKGIRFFTNQKDPAFIEKRRAALNHFMQSLVRVPRACALPDLLVFLEQTDRLRVTSVSANVYHHIPLTTPLIADVIRATATAAAEGTSPPALAPGTPTSIAHSFGPGSLGLRLKEGKGHLAPAFISQFLDDPAGGPGQAQRSGALRPGDVLVRVGNTSVEDLSYDQAVELVRTTARPAMLHFKRYPGPAVVSAPAAPPAADESGAAHAEAAPQQPSRQAADAATDTAGASGAAGAADGAASRERRRSSVTVGELTSASGHKGGLQLPVGNSSIVFPAEQVQHFDALLSRASPGAVTAGKVEGQAAASYLRKSQLSSTTLQHVWRLACGGRSLPALSRSQWFLAMRLVALAQRDGDAALQSAGPKALDAQELVPKFEGEPTMEHLADAAQEVGQGEEEDTFL